MHCFLPSFSFIHPRPKQYPYFRHSQLFSAQNVWPTAYTIGQLMDINFTGSSHTHLGFGAILSISRSGNPSWFRMFFVEVNFNLRICSAFCLLGVLIPFAQSLTASGETCKSWLNCLYVISALLHILRIVCPTSSIVFALPFLDLSQSCNKIIVRYS